MESILENETWPLHTALAWVLTRDEAFTARALPICFRPDIRLPRHADCFSACEQEIAWRLLHSACGNSSSDAPIPVTGRIAPVSSVIEVNPEVISKCDWHFGRSGLEAALVERSPSANPISIHDVELRGRLLDSPETVPAILGIVRPEHFQEAAHGRIFEAIIARHAAGSPCTPPTLAGDMKQSWKQPFIGDKTFGEYVARLLSVAALPMELKAYAADIRDTWAFRSMSEALQRASDADGMPASRLDILLTEIDSVRASLAEAKATRETAGETGAAVLQRVNASRMGNGEPTGATTGFGELDRVMLGYRSGELVIVGARPGIGKTTFGTSSAWQCAVAGNGVMFFSLELSRDAIGARLLADHSFSGSGVVTHSAIREARGLSDDQFIRLLQANEGLRQLSLEVDYAARLSVAELGARVAASKKRMARRGIALRVVFIDYLKQLKASDRYRGQRHYEVGEITAGLHEIAKREEVCIVLLCQLNRGIESESNKRPDLHHLRESGDIEADADVVLFLYRPAYYVSRTKEYQEGDLSALDEFQRLKNKLEVIVAKNRNGETCVVDLFCDMGASAVRNSGSRYGGHRQ